MKKKVSRKTIQEAFGRGIQVSVGYGWQKFDEIEGAAQNGRDVLYDTFWQSLKEEFRGKCDGVEDQLGVKVNLHRLRASHGKLVWPTILLRIAKSDVLIFDVAQPPDSLVRTAEGVDLKDIVTSINKNVLVEIGVALGLDKRVVLMCPRHLFDAVPSDIKGYLWTTYTAKVKGGKICRTIDDSMGLQNGFTAMLRDVVRDETGLNF